MRIAYISYEHPLGIPGGGIGTYLGQIARIMAKAGHQVEVFTCHKELNDTLAYDGYLLHRIQAENVADFRKNNLVKFTEQHFTEAFDVVEAAEYGADALNIKKQFPQLPLVVKLHTPSYLTQQLNEYKTTAFEKMRFFLGGLLRGTIPQRFWIYKKDEDPEYEQYCLADAICSPSKSLAHLIKERWPNKKSISVIPNPFVPDQSILDIPVAEYNTEKLVIGFFGRLEKRKGILDLMKAIPSILEHDHNIIFQFVGKSHPSPTKGMDMEAYMKKKLKKWNDNLQFYGYQPYDRMADFLSKTQICIFPSLWENFPNVCLEAMVAGKAVIASNNGGMADMITNESNGLLIEPNNPKKIAEAVFNLVKNHKNISRFGHSARASVLEKYNEEQTVARVTTFYNSTIQQQFHSAVVHR
jgi:glycogen synthase